MGLGGDGQLVRLTAVVSRALVPRHQTRSEVRQESNRRRGLALPDTGKKTACWPGKSANAGVIHAMLTRRC